jgi:HAD superfamily hydrolase (TIGR01509 family)
MQKHFGSPQLQAVIFDVDGTLVDSNDLHIEAWQLAFRRYGKELSYDAIHAQIGKGGDQLLPVFLAPDELKRFGSELEAYRGELFVRDYLPRAKPYPKVRALFERLHEEGLRLALATSAAGREIEQHMNKLGVSDLLDAHTSADDAEHSKPAPDIFEAALGRLGGIKAAEALVVGDSPFDIMAARRAGMHAVGLLSGGFTEAQLLEQGAIGIYADVSELLERFQDLPFAPSRRETASTAGE